LSRVTSPPGASRPVVLLAVAALFGLAPSARAEKILYERVTSQGERWWLIRPDGSHARPLPFFGTSQWPDLTLDGRRLVFTSLTGFSALMTSPLAHRRLRVVWRPRDLGWYPRWSPSGKRIAATTEVEPPSGWPENSNFFQVFVIQPGAGRPRRLRTPVSMRFQSWSPDGRRLAVTIQRRGRGSDIATIRADGSGLRVLTHGGNNFNPDWSR